jgi:hypothetical protein
MMDYGRVFQMVKSKLVRERGLILWISKNYEN